MKIGAGQSKDLNNTSNKREAADTQPLLDNTLNTLPLL